ncbi:hypothetical protein CKO11_11330 [Rhodobacter sp. TJ_12]|nr:hypothetical protein [Rhodobacter sp. TJ_12]
MEQEWHQPSLFDYFPPAPSAAPDPDPVPTPEPVPEPAPEPPAPAPDPDLPPDAPPAPGPDLPPVPEPDPAPEIGPAPAPEIEPEPDAETEAEAWLETGAQMAPAPERPAPPLALDTDPVPKTGDAAPPSKPVAGPPAPDPLERVVSLILSGTAPLSQEIPAAGQIDPTVNPLGALKEGLGSFAPVALSPIERMRLLSSHDRLMALRARLAQPPRPPPARR